MSIDQPACFDALKQEIGLTHVPDSEVIALSWYPSSAEGLHLNRDFHFKCLKIRVAQSRSVHPELSPRWTDERRYARPPR